MREVWGKAATVTVPSGQRSPVGLSAFKDVVSYCYPHKLPQTEWLKTTQMYNLTVLEVRSLKWVLLGENQGVGMFAFLLEAVGRISFLAFSAIQALAYGASSIFESSGVAFSNLRFRYVLTSPSLTFKDPCDYIGLI